VKITWAIPLLVPVLLLALTATCAAQNPGTSLVAQKPSSPSAPQVDVKSWSQPTEPFHIVGPIYYVGTRGLGVYLFATPTGHILLGGAVPGTAPLIEASIRKLGYKPEDIRILLLNHAHFDHAGTLADFKKLTGAPVEVMEGDVSLLKSGGETDYLFAKDTKLHFPPVTADRVLKDGEVVALGDLRLTAHHTPGHTRGCTTWATTVQEGGRSYSVVFPDGTSVNPGTRFVKDASYRGIADDYRHSFAVLESLHPDIFLSYHGEFFDLAGKRARVATEGVQAWIDPHGYRDQIAGAEARFERLVSQETASTSTSGQ
jgi:metallo-beta-lactamase class B